MSTLRNDHSHYDVLGVPPVADAQEIRGAYIKLAQKYHPDTGSNDATKFAEVTEAYSVLKDKERRAAYDATMRLLTALCTHCDGEGRVYRTKDFTQRIAALCSHCHGTGRA